MAIVRKEKDFQRLVIAYLNNIVKHSYKGNNLYFFKTIATNKRGVADLILCFKGNFIAIELKAKHGKESIAQQHFKQCITKCGGFCYTLYDSDNWQEELDKIFGQLCL